jgi:hypothetical protein
VTKLDDLITEFSESIGRPRALSELEKANASVRAAKQAVVKAKGAAEVADKHEEANATLAKARALHPVTRAKTASPTTPEASNSSRATDESATAPGTEESEFKLNS